MKYITFLALIVLSLSKQAGEVKLLGQSERIAFDDVKTEYVARTVERLSTLVPPRPKSRACRKLHIKEFVL